MNKAKLTSLPHNTKLALLVIPLLLVAAFGIKFVATGQQADQSLEISPPSQEIEVDPGETITIKSSVRNKSTNSLPIEVRLEDFTAVGDEGQVELTASSPYSIKSWGDLTPENFELSPGETQEVSATIKIPEDAAGGRYGSFVFAVKGDSKPGSAAIAQEIASLFLVRISGPVDEKLTLLEFSSPSFSEFGPIPFSIKVKNTGNVHAKPYGLVSVTDMFGRKVEDVIIYETNVFPGAERILTANLNKKFLIGKYNATAIVYYGSEQSDTLTSSLTFFVFPVKIAVGIIAVTVFLFLLRKRFSKAFKALMGK